MGPPLLSSFRRGPPWSGSIARVTPDPSDSAAGTEPDAAVLGLREYEQSTHAELDLMA